MADKKDNLYPDISYSVDDILNEVRLMKQAAGELNQPVKPFNSIESDADLVASQHTKSINFNSETADLPENAKKSADISGVDISSNQDDKLSKFLNKSHDNNYIPDSNNAKRQLDVLFGDDDSADNAVFSPFSNQRRRAPHALTPEELGGVTTNDYSNDDDLQSTPQNQNIEQGLKADLEKIDFRRASRTAPANTLVFDPAELNQVKNINAPIEPKINGFKINTPLENEQTPSSGFSATNPPAPTPYIKPEQTQLDTQIPANNNADVSSNSIRTKKDIFSSSETTSTATFIKPFNSNANESLDNSSDDDVLFVEDDKRLRMPFREIKGFKLTGDEQDNDDCETLNNDDFDYEEIDDYSSIDDAESVRFDLESRSAKLSRKLTLTLIISILLSALTILPLVGVSLPEIISPANNPNTFLTLNTGFLVLAILINFSSVIRGFFSLFALKVDIDTSVAISSVAALIHSVYLFWHQAELSSGKVMVYSALAAIALLFNIIGKRCMMARVKHNFEFVANANIKQACFIADDNDAMVIAEDSAVAMPYLCCDKSVINLQGYLNHAFCEDPADNMCKTLAPLGLIVAVISGFLILLVSGDMTMAVTTFAAITCVCVPLTSLLATNLPLLSSSKRLLELGGMISGYDAATEFADVDCVAIDAEELFPAGSVDLLSLKSFGDTPIDETILDAAALAIHAGGPLSDIFDKMIEGRRKLLPNVETLVYEDNKGITGIVKSRQIRIGNRQLMESHNVKGMPDVEFDRRIIRNGSYPVYLAIGSGLAGMFIVTYNAHDEDMSEQLKRLVKSGVTLLVKTSDANITPELISRLFHLPEAFIKIMPSHAVQRYDSITRPCENGDGIMAHANSVAAYAANLVACRRLRGNTLLATILQTIGVILGFGSVMFFALTQEYNLILPNVIAAYQLISAAIVLIIPSLRRT